MKCMYCNKEIKRSESHNPEDHGLHTPYLDFRDKGTCEKCNMLVTITNRRLKKILETDGDIDSLNGLDFHFKLIKEIYKK